MSTMSEVSPDDWDLWRDYFRGGRELVAALDRRLQDDAGISHPEYLLMMSLWYAPDQHLRTGELAEELSWEKSRVSHQVSR
ncbi:winged helix-turn-helix transcriptional regulator, partial [Schumannella luteola]